MTGFTCKLTLHPSHSQVPPSGEAAAASDSAEQTTPREPSAVTPPSRLTTPRRSLTRRQIPSRPTLAVYSSPSASQQQPVQENPGHTTRAAILNHSERLPRLAPLAAQSVTPPAPSAPATRAQPPKLHLSHLAGSKSSEGKVSSAVTVTPRGAASYVLQKAPSEHPGPAATARKVAVFGPGKNSLRN